MEGAGTKEEGETEAAEGWNCQDLAGTGLDEESTLDEGLGSTSCRCCVGVVLVQQSDAADKPLHRDRQKFLQRKYARSRELEKRARAQRERDRATGQTGSYATASARNTPDGRTNNETSNHGRLPIFSIANTSLTFSSNMWMSMVDSMNQKGSSS